MAAATLVSRSAAVSAAGRPSTSRRISAARWRGGSTCRAARKASSIVSRSIDDRVGLVVGRCDLVEQPVGIGLQPGHLGEGPEVGDAARAAADHVEADVGGDAVQPRPQHRVVVERVAIPPRPQERLLHRVLGLVERRQHAVAVDVQLAPVPLRQGLEGPLVELTAPLMPGAVPTDLLDDPAVAVGVAEGDERAVVLTLRVRPGLPAVGPKWRISLASTPRSTSRDRAFSMSATTRCMPCTEPGVAGDPLAEGDGAGRARGGQLHHPEGVAGTGGRRRG